MRGMRLRWVRLGLGGLLRWIRIWGLLLRAWCGLMLTDGRFSLPVLELDLLGLLGRRGGCIDIR